MRRVIGRFILGVYMLVMGCLAKFNVLPSEHPEIVGSMWLIAGVFYLRFMAGGVENA